MLADPQRAIKCEVQVLGENRQLLAIRDHLFLEFNLLRTYVIQISPKGKGMKDG